METWVVESIEPNVVLSDGRPGGSRMGFAIGNAWQPAVGDSVGVVRDEEGSIAEVWTADVKVWDRD